MINKNKQLNIKLSQEEYNNLVKKCKELKFNSISEYSRFILLNSIVEVKVSNE